MKLLVSGVLLGLLVVVCNARPKAMKVKRQTMSNECYWQLRECNANIDHNVIDNSFSALCHVRQHNLQCDVTVFSRSECYDQQRLSRSQQLLQLMTRHCAEHADAYTANWHCFTDRESRRNVRQCMRHNIYGPTCSVDDFVDCVGTAYDPSCSAEFVQAEQDVNRAWVNIMQYCSQLQGGEEFNHMLMKNWFV